MLSECQAVHRPNVCCTESCVRASAQLQRIPQSPGHAGIKVHTLESLSRDCPPSKGHSPITASIVSHRALRPSQTWVGYQLKSKNWQINKYINNSIWPFIPSPRYYYFVSEHRYEGWLRGQNRWEIYLSEWNLRIPPKNDSSCEPRPAHLLEAVSVFCRPPHLLLNVSTHKFPFEHLRVLFIKWNSNGFAQYFGRTNSWKSAQNN